MMLLHRAQDVRSQLVAHLRGPHDGPCTRDTVRCVIARDYGQRLPDCCRGHLIRLVSDVVEVLNTHRVTWWADYGTLLGAVRNPLTTGADYPWLMFDDPTALIPAGIVPHDKDADFGALHTDWRTLSLKCAPIIESMGYHVTVRPIGFSLKVRLSEVNHTNLDVFTWLQRPDGSLFRTRYIGVDAYKGRDFPKSYLHPESRVTWEGVTLKAPAHPAGFCQMRYGYRWMTPVAANHDGVQR